MPPAQKRPKRTNQPIYTATRIFSHTSPITKVNLLGFLASCVSSWSTSYSEEQKRNLLQSFPPAYHTFAGDNTGKLQCPLSTNFCHEDFYFREATQRFQRDVADGYYEAQWQNLANKAVQERKDGKFDAYISQRIQNDFGESGQENEKGESKEEDIDYSKRKGRSVGKAVGVRARPPGGPVGTSARVTRGRGLRGQEHVGLH